jgi:hypothetical protein
MFYYMLPGTFAWQIYQQNIPACRVTVFLHNAHDPRMGGRAAIEQLLGGALPAWRRGSIPGGGSSTRMAPLRAPAVMAGPKHTAAISGSKSTRTACGSIHSR